jgi:hypothetical protein
MMYSKILSPTRTETYLATKIEHLATKNKLAQLEEIHHMNGLLLRLFLLFAVRLLLVGGVGQVRRSAQMWLI